MHLHRAGLPLRVSNRRTGLPLAGLDGLALLQQKRGTR